MPKLIMFIGIPGSGKSTAAKKYQRSFSSHSTSYPRIYEADQFFMLDGKYHWDPKFLPMAHQWCQGKVMLEMIDGHDVIVSNTCLTPKERSPYLKMAKKFGYEVEVHTCVGNFQNVHGVPQETIERMKKKFVPYSENEIKNI